MVNEVRLRIADFLNTKIIENKVTFLNLWHVVHFISGAIVMFFILKLFKKYDIEWKLLMLVGGLILYEILEITFINSGSSLFRGETGLDIFWDIAIGFLGGVFVLRFKKSFLSH